MVSQRDTNEMDALGARFLSALCSQNWEMLRALFTPDVRFRGLTPPGLREATDAAAALDYLRRWFGDADVLTLLSSDVQRVQDRLAIRYRFRVHEDGWYVVEQQAYCSVRGDAIERMDLLCSGFRPEDGNGGA